MKNLLLIIPFLCFALQACIDEDGIDAISATNSSCVDNAQRDNTSAYFWYKGERVELVKAPNKHYITCSANIINKAQNSDLSVDKKEGFKQVRLTSLTPVNSNKQPLSLWGIVDDVNIEKISILSAVTYSSPTYLTMDGYPLTISHLFYVKLKSEKDEQVLIDFASKNKVDVLGKDEYLPRWYTLSCSKESNGDALTMANRFQESGLFEIAEPDIMTSLQQTKKSFSVKPNDTYFPKQWNLNGSYSINLNLSLIQNYGKGVRIGLIDSGVEMTHPDINLPNGLISFDLVVGTRDYINSIYGPHGTACAGILLAKANNSKGIAGIVPNAELISYSHPMTAIPNAVQQLADGLSHAAENCDIISCSWGDNSLVSSLIEDALKYYAFNWGRNGKGTVVVFSTGNNNSNVLFPANCNDKILTVGSINSSGRRSSFSNYGNKLDVVAPGEKIPTLDLLGRDGYSTNEYTMDFQGTSAACPHVAAVAALVLSANPNLKGTEVNEIIEKTAKKLSGYNFSMNKENGTWNNEVGYGLVDAEAAVAEALKRKK